MQNYMQTSLEAPILIPEELAMLTPLVIRRIQLTDMQMRMQLGMQTAVSVL